MFLHVKLETFFLLPILIFLSSSSAALPESPSTCKTCNYQLLLEAEKFATSYRRCLLNHLLKDNETKVWNEMPSAIRSCLALETFSEAMTRIRLGRPQPALQSKVVILPPSIGSTCIAVIGRIDDLSAGEGSAEEELLQLAPLCVQHIAVPDPQFSTSKKIFYDKIIAFDQDGDDRWNRLASQLNTDGYVPDPRKITLKNFLEKDVQKEYVDYLWIDSLSIIIGSAANGLLFSLPLSHFPGYLIFMDPIDVTVCQATLNTEITRMHGKFDVNGYTRYALNKLVGFIVSNSSFLPLHSEFLIKEGVLRTLYFNISSPYCLQKFFGLKFCGHGGECQMEGTEAEEEISGALKEDTTDICTNEDINVNDKVTESKESPKINEDYLKLGDEHEELLGF